MGAPKVSIEGLKMPPFTARRPLESALNISNPAKNIYCDIAFFQGNVAGMGGGSPTSSTPRASLRPPSPSPRHWNAQRPDESVRHFGNFSLKKRKFTQETLAHVVINYLSSPNRGTQTTSD
jgi:hypothetical protein